MTQSPVKIGIIGVGRMGLLHLQKYLQIPSAEVVGVYENNPARAAELRAQFQVRTFENLDDLFFESDAVSLASPTANHYSIGRHALEAGVNLLIEKPITETQSEAETLIKIAREKNLVLQVGFIERFRYQALATNFPSAPIRFFESHRLSSTLNREPSVDVVSDLMIHDLDLALSLIGEQPSYISAIGMQVLTGHYDIANVRLDFPSGAVANLNASRVSATTQRKIRVFSASAYASLNFMTNEVEFHSRNDQMKIEKTDFAPRSLDPLYAQCSHFVDCVRLKSKPLVSGEDGLLALKYAKIVREKIDQRNRLEGRNLPYFIDEKSPNS